MVLYTALWQRNQLLNGSEKAGDVAGGVTTALDLQKPQANDIRGQRAQTLLT
jgi:hypothetical protein